MQMSMSSVESLMDDECKCLWALGVNAYFVLDVIDSLWIGHIMVSVLDCRFDYDIVVACAYLSKGSLSIHIFVLSMRVHCTINNGKR